MDNRTQKNLLTIIDKITSDRIIKNTFISRINEGSLTRDENPYSHLCIYFAAYDPHSKMVFLGRHIKSGLWLFNGGHVDKGEVLIEALYREMNEEWGLVKKIENVLPSLLTITEIKNPQKQPCRIHYDIWYFIPFNKESFIPEKKLIGKEFFEWGWKTVEEAKKLVKNKETLDGIEKLNSLFLQ